MTSLIIGVDPGKTTGICALTVAEAPVSPLVYQAVGYESVLLVVNALIDQTVWDECWISVEKFVVSGRAGRSAFANTGAQTRELIGALGTLGVQKFTVNAATAKSWATDRMLEAAGLIEPTKGMGHARDAARHALFAAVNKGLMPNPMSKAATL